MRSSLSGDSTSRPLVDGRKSAFTKTWALQEARIDSIINYIDHDKVKSLEAFLTADTIPARRSDRIRTALLLSSVDGASHNIVIDHLRDNGGSVVARLQARQCHTLPAALKHIIKLAISDHGDVAAYKRVIEEHKRLIPMNFDLELLHTYVQEHQISNVIIAIPDIEVFDSQVTAELISTVHQWCRRIPFVLLLGITSTTSLFQRRLTRTSIRVLDAKTFDLTPSPNIYSDIIRTVQAPLLDQDGRLVAAPSFDSSIISQLHALTDSQALTTRAFKSAIKYVYMSHYFANVLSTVYCTASPAERDYLADMIRNTDSFRSHCEELLTTKGSDSIKHLRSLLEDNEALLTEVRTNISAHQAEYHALCETIAALTDLHNTVCAADSTTTTPSVQKTRRTRFEQETELYQSSHDLTDTTIYTEIKTALQNLGSDQIKSHLANLTSRLAQQLATDMDDNDDHTSKKATNGSSPNRTTQLLHQLLKTASMPNLPSALLLHESWLLSSKSIHLRSKFDPAPRAALERALLRPQDYLAFDLESPSTGTKPRTKQHQNSAGAGQESEDDDEEKDEHDDQNDMTYLPPPAASILMTLLQEAPVTINMRDLYDAFESRMISQQTQTQTQTQTQLRSEPDSEDQPTPRGMLAVFYRTVAEMRMLGFVKSCTGHVVVRRGGNRGGGRGGMGDVEFIAKTSWAGL